MAISSKGGTTAQIHPSSDCLYLSFRRSIVISTNKLLCLTRDVTPSLRSLPTDCVGPMILIGRSSAEKKVEAGFIRDTALIWHFLELQVFAETRCCTSSKTCRMILCAVGFTSSCS